jgi:AraC-like DNA-binding protein
LGQRATIRITQRNSYDEFFKRMDAWLGWRRNVGLDSGWYYTRRPSRIYFRAEAQEIVPVRRGGRDLDPQQDKGNNAALTHHRQTRERGPELPTIALAQQIIEAGCRDGLSEFGEAEYFFEAFKYRISEVAFEVGFQSLAQSNRSFHRIAGASPQPYRASRGDTGENAWFLTRDA